MAGIILRKVKAELREKIRPDTPLLWIANHAESRIRELGGDLAFPVNLSMDADAAHDTASPDDKRVVGESLLKVDIGVHVNGYIADSAFSMSFNPGRKELISSSEEALENAIKAVRPGITIGEIGGIIEETIKSHGFVPVSNLTGHGLGRYVFHDDPQIFNIRNNSKKELEYGQVIAIEPFATDGRGMIRESGRTEIYSLARPIPVRNADERRIEKYAMEKQGLPFSRREVYQSPRTNLSLTNLLRKGVLYGYSVLTEVEGGIVSQSEHTMIVLDRAEIMT